MTIIKSIKHKAAELLRGVLLKVFGLTDIRKTVLEIQAYDAKINSLRNELHELESREST